MGTYAIQDVKTNEIIILGDHTKSAAAVGLKNSLFFTRRVGKIVDGFKYLNITDKFILGDGI